MSKANGTSSFFLSESPSLANVLIVLPSASFSMSSTSVYVSTSEFMVSLPAMAMLSLPTTFCALDSERRYFRLRITRTLSTKTMLWFSLLFQKQMYTFLPLYLARSMACDSHSPSRPSSVSPMVGMKE